MAVRDWEPRRILWLWIGMATVYVALFIAGRLKMQREVGRVERDWIVASPADTVRRPLSHADSVLLDSLRDSVVKLLRPAADSILAHSGPALEELGQEFQRAMIIAVAVVMVPPLTLGALTLYWWVGRRRLRPA